ncbi:nuclear transport factor 2 family protein [Oenococcus kitaharae]|uniref:nuclear transport factor 2 family protein n=1 Tax=Oenococcus TaxID=46254 RepID=UPI0021E94F43|nr:nuclear transport factor 2 family protein [Oenococcus kitaharae]MCV3296870.1 nuclear transport factor 2 family protein [Oenococcus kitaharae]
MAADAIQSIRSYFQMWVDRDFLNIDCLFDWDIYYRECYGACYRNLDELHLWIESQLKKQVVLDWHLHDVYEDGHYFFVTWTFRAKEKETYVFDGLSKIKFNSQNKISEIIEYETKHDVFYPFKKSSYGR